MSLFDHIGISVRDLSRSVAQFDPVMSSLGCTRQDADDSVSWYRGEEELVLYPARKLSSVPIGRDAWAGNTWLSRWGLGRRSTVCTPLRSRLAGRRYVSRNRIHGSAIAITRPSSKTTTACASSSCTIRPKNHSTHADCQPARIVEASVS